MHTPETVQLPTVTPDPENPFRDGCGFVGGDFLPLAQTAIPIVDAGFVRSDLTYDVVGVWDGRFFRVEDHLDRLFRGLARIRLESPLSRDELRDVMLGCVRRTGFRESYVQTIVTRGVPPRGERDPRKFDPRVYAVALPYVWILRPEAQLEGTDVIVARDTVRIPVGAVDPTVKNFHWGDLTRGILEAYDREGFIALLPDGDGNITEGPGVNVFAVVDGRLCTPSRGVLHGITRKVALEIAAEAGLQIHDGDVPVSWLYRATEIFLTSTAGGIMPVRTLDRTPVGDGRPGDVTMSIRQRYWELHTDPQHTLAIDYDA